MAVGSFSAGLSGLAANSTALNVIGNNLANLNTVGFKASTVTFQDLVSQTLGGSGSSQVGLGVITGAIAPVFSQGSIETTRESTNVALQGNGFFIVNRNGANSYTRAGNFGFDATGALVTPEGFRVQGYTAINPVTGALITTGQPTDIVVPPGVLHDPVPTTEFQTMSNLNAEALVGETFNTSVQIYDSLGASHVMTLAYTKTAANAWSFEITVPGAEVNPAPLLGAPAVLAAGSLTFGADGQIASITPTAPATGGGNAVPGPIVDFEFTTPTWANGADPNDVTWNLVDDLGAVSLTGFSSPSATASETQNGLAAGMLQNISISEEGVIIATFGVGRSLPVAQLALATFNNPKGLVKLGGNRYGESDDAGLPSVGVAGTGGRGTLIGSALEQSNVDIAQEFTQMILAQRGYQANSKTITVTDELLVDTLNIKR